MSEYHMTEADAAMRDDDPPLPLPTIIDVAAYARQAGYTIPTFLNGWLDWYSQETRKDNSAQTRAEAFIQLSMTLYVQHCQRMRAAWPEKTDRHSR